MTVLSPDGSVAVEVLEDNSRTGMQLFAGDGAITPVAMLEELLNQMQIPSTA